MQFYSSDPHNSGPAPRMSQEARVAPSDANAKKKDFGVFFYLLFLKLIFVDPLVSNIQFENGFTFHSSLLPTKLS